MRIFNSAHVGVPGRLVRRGAGLRTIRLTVRYGLIELNSKGLCLVDTGFGPEVTGGPRSTALRFYNSVLRPDLNHSQLPEATLRNLGATAADVRLVVVTHFHADHVCSLRAFPRARIVTCGEAAHRVGAMSSTAALRHGIFKELIPPDFERRIVPLQEMQRQPSDTALGEGYDLFGDGSYLAIPLPGHAFGHFGIFWRDETGPVIYATDAAWTTAALMKDETPWLAMSIVFDQRRIGRETQALLREFCRQGGRIHLCHDIEESKS
jgi:glyoxylase-like metal-dependent hydrolase (beta-lactamase superfamily II)